MGLLLFLIEEIKMAVTTKNGWIFAVRELEAALAAGSVSEKPEVVALTPIASPSTATAEEIANAVNAIIAALKA